MAAEKVGWVRRDAAASTCTAHRTSQHCTTEAGMKQCWLHKQTLAVLSVGCLSAKNTCVTVHVSVFQMSQFYSTKLALCTGGWHTLESTARYICLVLFWKEKDSIDQTQVIQSLQATPVRIIGRFQIDVKIKNPSLLYVNHFSPKTRQHQTLSQGKFSTNLIKSKPLNENFKE